MSKLNKKSLLGFWKSNKEHACIVNEAKETFADKPFSEEYKPIRTISERSGMFLPVVSIVTGITTGAVILNVFLDFFWVSLFLSGCFFLGLEYAKAKILHLSFVNLYKGSSKSFLIVFAIALSLLSGYASVNGIIELEHVTNTAETRVNDDYTLRKDSVNLYYTALIDTAKSAAADTKATYNYKGKIYSEDGSKELLYTSQKNEILALQKEHRQAIKDLKGSQSEELTTTRADSSKKLYTAIGFVLFIEVSILLANWFPIFYLYQTKEENVTIEEITGQTITVTPDQIVNVFRQMNTVTIPGIEASLNSGPNEGVQKGTKKGTIGFKSTDEKTALESNKEGLNPHLKGVQESKDLSTQLVFLNKYKNVVKCIENGYTNKEIVKRAGVSISTVHNVKRCLKTLKVTA